MVTIIVDCKAPKRVRGIYTFHLFKELVDWLHKNFKRPKGYANMVTLAVAETGKYKGLTGWRTIDIRSDRFLCYEAKEIAYEKFARRGRGIGNSTFPQTDWGFEFAKILDDRLKYKEA